MMAGINSSVVIVIYACNILTTAFAFKIIYKENLHLVHYIGILFMMACVVFIANGRDGSGSTGKVVPLEDQISVVYPILVAFGTCMVFTCNCIITRTVHKTQKMSMMQYFADSNLLSTIVMFMLFVIEYNREPYHFIESIPVVVSSLVSVGAGILLNMGIAHGKAGIS